MHSAGWDKHRKLRFVTMGLFIVFTGLAGYHWGTFLEGAEFRPSEHDIGYLAGACTLLALTLGLYAEFLVFRTEEAARSAEDERKRESEDASVSKNHVMELQRLLVLVTDENATLRWRLHHQGAPEETGDAPTPQSGY